MVGWAVTADSVRAGGHHATRCSRPRGRRADASTWWRAAPGDIPLRAAGSTALGLPAELAPAVPGRAFIARADEDAPGRPSSAARPSGTSRCSRVEPGPRLDLWTAGAWAGSRRGARRGRGACSSTTRVGRGSEGPARTAVVAIRESGRTPVLDVVQETARAASSTDATGGRWSARADPGGCRRPPASVGAPH